MIRNPTFVSTLRSGWILHCARLKGQRNKKKHWNRGHSKTKCTEKKCQTTDLNLCLPIFFRKYSLNRCRSFSQDMRTISGRFWKNKQTHTHSTREEKTTRRQQAKLFLHTISTQMIISVLTICWKHLLCDIIIIKLFDMQYTGAHCGRVQEGWAKRMNTYFVLLVLHNLTERGHLWQ